MNKALTCTVEPDQEGDKNITAWICKYKYLQYNIDDRYIQPGLMNIWHQIKNCFLAFKCYKGEIVDYNKIQDITIRSKVKDVYGSKLKWTKSYKRCNNQGCSIHSKSCS